MLSFSEDVIFVYNNSSEKYLVCILLFNSIEIQSYLGLIDHWLIFFALVTQLRYLVT